MTLATRRIGILLILSAALTFVAAPVGALTLIMRSGNAPAGLPDPLITQLPLASACGVGYPTAFGAPEFSAASAGAPAIVLSFVHPAWIPGLHCDPLAQWIGTTAGAAPLSTLYAMDFFVPGSDPVTPCCYDKASLDICWSSDDTMGDAINPAGLYVNGAPIPAMTGGNFTVESSLTGVDVLPYIHCGTNTLYFYNPDIGCAVSGLIFSANLNLHECITPATPSSWGSVKAHYR